jgi:hypothetical protein
VAAGARERLGVADRRLGPLLGQQRVSEFLLLLRPAWWVLRGYLVAMVLAWLLDDSGQPLGLLPRIGGSEVVAALLLVSAVLGSVWLGRRSAGLTRWPRYALWSGTVVLVLVALGGFLNADSSSRGSNYQDVAFGAAPFAVPYADGSPVEDVYAYDSEGRLLTGVRLFDQDGRPIRLSERWCPDQAPGNGLDPAPGGFDRNELSAPTAPAGGTGVYPYCPASPPFGGLTPTPTPSAPTPAASTPATPSAAASPPAANGSATPGAPATGSARPPVPRAPAGRPPAAGPPAPAPR